MKRVQENRCIRSRRVRQQARELENLLSSKTVVACVKSARKQDSIRVGTLERE